MAGSVMEWGREKGVERTRRGRAGSQPERISLFVAGLRLGRKRRHCIGFVEPDIGIELTRKLRRRIMAQAFSVGPVNHADETLKPRIHELPANAVVAPCAQIEQETRHARIVRYPLIAVWPGRKDT